MLEHQVQIIAYNAQWRIFMKSKFEFDSGFYWRESRDCCFCQNKWVDPAKISDAMQSSQLSQRAKKILALLILKRLYEFWM